MAENPDYQELSKQDLVDSATDDQVRAAFEALPEAFILRFMIEAEGVIGGTTTGVHGDMDSVDSS